MRALASLALATLLVACAPVAMLREEWEPLDAPFTDSDLERDFMAIALRSEFSAGFGGALGAGGETTLARWEKPVRYAFIGARPTDKRRAEKLTRKLSRLTGRPFYQTPPEQAEFIVRFVSKNERQAVVGAISQGGENQASMLAREWAKSDALPCIGAIRRSPPDGPIVAAEILIKDDLPDVYRKACLVEEVTQCLGLLNDSDDARPSIFNDDQEFIALTRHDEKLLQALYHPRLEPGMSAAEVRPLLPGIFANLREQDALEAAGRAGQ